MATYTINYNDMLTERDVSSSKDNEFVVYKYRYPIFDIKYNNFRSVICKDGRAVCFSPPKSMSHPEFCDLHTSGNANVIAEEYIEGTMINAFWDGERWRISTRSKIDAVGSFFDTNGGFDKMVAETLVECKLDLNTLNPEHCYSFVMQHPDNRIVTAKADKSLFLISTYQIDSTESGASIRVVERDATLWASTAVRFPARLDWALTKRIVNEPYTMMGVVFKNVVSGDRCKLRNPFYEYVRRLRGNQTKLKYHYFELMKMRRINEYLKYFPEHTEQFSEFREKLHTYTKGLYHLYVSVFIRKTEKIESHRPQRTALTKLHTYYKTALVQQKLSVNLFRVINYVNLLPSAILMAETREGKTSAQLEEDWINENA